MSNRKAKSALLYLALAVALCSAGTAARGQDSDDGKGHAAHAQRRRDVPVVDFTAAESASTPPALRAKKRRHDLKDASADASRFVLKESDPAELYELPASHAPEVAAIPAAQSDAVVIGEVVGSEAHLSNDRTSVFSEFTLQVGEVLKNTAGREVGVGGQLIAERAGGGVRFPSGKVLRRGRLRETMPLVGRRYVLFLRHDAEADSFSIVTGYELRDGRVFPLDGVEVPEGGSKLRQFAAYEGVEEAAFLAEVRSAIQGQPTGGARRGAGKDKN